MAIIQFYRILLPNFLVSWRLLHSVIYLFAKYLIKPEGYLLVARHLYLSSEIMEFLCRNIPGVELTFNPLKPTKVEEIKNGIFLQHAMSRYNFIVPLNKQLRQRNRGIEPPSKLNCHCITDGAFPIEPLQHHWTNCIDVETSVLIIYAVTQLLVSKRDYEAINLELQMDETMALYLSTVLKSDDPLWIVSNRNPLLPLGIIDIGPRVLLHSLWTEEMHAILVQYKRSLKT